MAGPVTLVCTRNEKKDSTGKGNKLVSLHHGSQVRLDTQTHCELKSPLCFSGVIVNLFPKQLAEESRMPVTGMLIKRHNDYKQRYLSLFATFYANLSFSRFLFVAGGH